MVDNSGSDEVRRLAAQLATADADGRVAAAEGLARAGDAATAAVVELVQACGDEDDRVREWAAAALEDLGPPPAASLAELTDLAAAAHPLVAYWAVTLLGRSGQDAAAAVPVLIGCLEAAGDLAVQQRAAWALGKIGRPAAAAREALTRASGATDPRLARLAAEALAAIGG